MEDNRARRTAHFDLLTVAAISVIAYVLANVVHEALGHGGTCLIVGGRPLGLSSVWFEGDLCPCPVTSAGSSPVASP